MFFFNLQSSSLFTSLIDFDLITSSIAHKSGCLTTRHALYTLHYSVFSEFAGNALVAVNFAEENLCILLNLQESGLYVDWNSRNLSRSWQILKNLEISVLNSKCYFFFIYYFLQLSVSITHPLTLSNLTTVQPAFCPNVIHPSIHVVHFSF